VNQGRNSPIDVIDRGEGGFGACPGSRSLAGPREGQPVQVSCWTDREETSGSGWGGSRGVPNEHDMGRWLGCSGKANGEWDRTREARDRITGCGQSETHVREGNRSSKGHITWGPAAIRGEVVGHGGDRAGSPNQAPVGESWVDCEMRGRGRGEMRHRSALLAQGARRTSRGTK